MKLGGITLNVKDLDSAKQFYGKLPGAKLIRDEENLASFDFGGARVSLKKADDPGFHLEMESTTEVRKHLGENGLQIESEEKDKVFLNDPDGHKIEVELDSSETENHGAALFNPQINDEDAGLG